MPGVSMAIKVFILVSWRLFKGVHKNELLAFKKIKKSNYESN